MRIRPFKLINKTEFGFIHVRVQEILAGWTEKWLLDNAMSVAAAAADNAKESIGGGAANWRRVSISPECWVGIYASFPSLNLLSTSLSGARSVLTEEPPSPLLCELVNKALLDLAESVFTGLLGKQERADIIRQAPPEETWKWGSGAVLIDLGFAGEKFHLLLSPELTNRTLGKVAASQESTGNLISVVEALASQTAELDVWLGDAELELAVIQSISVGDVIRFEKKIDQPLHVCLKDNKEKEICVGFPGAYKGNKAIQLTIHSK